MWLRQGPAADTPHYLAVEATEVAREERPPVLAALHLALRKEAPIGSTCRPTGIHVTGACSPSGAWNGVYGLVRAQPFEAPIEGRDVSLRTSSWPQASPSTPPTVGRPL